MTQLGHETFDSLTGKQMFGVTGYVLTQTHVANDGSGRLETNSNSSS